MSIVFNADDLVEMAVRTEENAAAFYRRAAALHDREQRASSYLLRLAGMEDRHARTFAQMRTQLSAQETETTAYDPYDEGKLYLDAMADGHGGEGSPARAESLTGRESQREMLRMAVDLERRTILFYLGLRDMVSPELGRSKVDQIIREEKSHLVTLASELRKIPAEAGKEKGGRICPLNWASE